MYKLCIVMFDYPCCTMFLEVSLLRSMFSVIQVLCPFVGQFAVQVFCSASYTFLHRLTIRFCDLIKSGQKHHHNLYINMTFITYISSTSSCHS
jgi:hypothetical protein